MPDGNWLAQLGALVIHNDPVAESELWAMAPPGVTLHSARFESPTSTGAEYTGSSWRMFVDSADVTRGLRQLGQMELSAICLCFGSCSFFGGAEFDEGFTAAAREKAGGTPVFTAAQAILGALAAAGIRRPLVVMPPWFTRPTFDAAERYLAAAGFPAAGVLRFELGGRWRDVPHHRLFDLGAHREIRVEDVCEQVGAAFPADADGVLVPGSGFRSWEAIEPLERALGVPVVTANQAVLWRLLDRTGVEVAVPGGGRLFSEHGG
ncbi:maleate cis-trans isomerase family protein [Saccharothrix obliqua]|uniref:maleate cis-trans isomerase family protein n=1 Tax=Saccharothrix obliqua TaxID=2861747 RepID=UPI001C5F824F|nr:hypothetical protein [Saccharothrix obliqua]MBW4721905.1 hypothetical protein [Saccharothrix obliqua]